MSQKSRVRSKANRTWRACRPKPHSTRNTPSHSTASPSVVRAPGVAIHGVATRGRAAHRESLAAASQRQLDAIDAGGRERRIGTETAGGGLGAHRQRIRRLATGARAPLASRPEAMAVGDARTGREIVVAVVVAELLCGKRI